MVVVNGDLLGQLSDEAFVEFGAFGLLASDEVLQLCDTLGLRHELLQTLEHLIQLRLLGKHLFNKRSVIRHIVGERSFAVRRRIVKRDSRNVAEFAVDAVAVAQPLFASRTEALAAILHAFPQRRAPAVILAILVLRNLVPLPGGLVVDAIGFRFFFHVRLFLICLNPQKPNHP